VIKVLSGSDEGVEDRAILEKESGLERLAGNIGSAVDEEIEGNLLQETESVGEHQLLHLINPLGFWDTAPDF
jgi:hypothetical protein